MSTTIYRGVVREGAVILEQPGGLPDGTEVQVTPIEARLGSPRAILEAVESPPYVDPEAVDELMRGIEEGRQPVNRDNPLTPDQTPA